MDPIFDVFADKSGFVLNEEMAKEALAEPTYPRVGLRKTFADPPVIFCDVDRPKRRPAAARPMLARSLPLQPSTSQTSTGSTTTKITTSTAPTTASALSDWDFVMKPSHRESRAFRSLFGFRA
ncbi:hypothetical protein EXIGLDRAFT_694844 [Exidia glandulosa HHB12029]|uniref:Uncharacterized protein n=1 Tax=Exidia glandulosa HHB12029 TaxID=1314781 RepID=A0A165GD91_EXIGL|nr:hypothetical protein EXIGLDRAFT_694844 [Exidia glandulosa HHB12029]